MAERSMSHMVVDSIAPSYLSATSSLPGSAADATAAVSLRKRSKYAAIALTHIFVPVAVETLGPVKIEGLPFLDQIGDRLSAVTRDPHESSFLYQRLSLIVQRFNMIAFRGSFISETDIGA